jgi:hypothetical protein
MRRMSPARRGPLAAAVTALSAGLAGLVCCLSLGGCSGSDPGPAPTTMHPGTAATPTTATPSGNPTDIAAIAAIAAVQKLYAELNRSLTTGDTTSYRRTFTRACTLCLTDARVTDRLSAKDERVVGGGYRATELNAVYNQPGLVIVQGVLSEPPLVVMKGARVIARQGRLTETSFTWRAVPVNGTWLISAVEVLK